MKLTNLIFIIVGVEILLWLGGINQSMGVVITEFNINNPVLIATSWLFTKANYILGLAVGATVIIGFFSKSSTENALVAVVAAFFLKFVADLVGIILIMNSYCEAFTAPYASCAWATWLVVAMMVPIAVVFVMAVLDWWRGRD